MLQVGDCLLGSIHQRLAAAQILEETLQQLMGVDRTVRQQLAGRHLLAIVDHHIAAQQDRILADGIVGLDDCHHSRFVVFALLDLNGAGLFAEDR